MGVWAIWRSGAHRSTLASRAAPEASISSAHPRGRSPLGGAPLSPDLELKGVPWSLAGLRAQGVVQKIGLRGRGPYSCHLSIGRAKGQPCAPPCFSHTGRDDYHLSQSKDMDE